MTTVFLTGPKGGSGEEVSSGTPVGDTATEENRGGVETGGRIRPRRGVLRLDRRSKSSGSVFGILVLLNRGV